MGDTKIEWTEKVWNPVTGCTPVSDGCTHCYAKAMAQRLQGRFGYPQDDPFAVTLHPDRLEEPLHWKKPRMVFVSSMGDLFHPRVPWDFIFKVFSMMEDCPQHTFQVLTKRPSRMAHYARGRIYPWPPNVWAGTSVESARYLPRLDVLARIPAPVRFVSFEPLLDDVGDLQPWLGSTTNFPGGQHWVGGILNWCIIGGESGPKARPMHPDWARSVQRQCQAAGVPFFYKSAGEYLLVADARRRGLSWSTEKVEPSSGYYMARVGRRAAGALLDGVVYREWPNNHFRTGS